MCVAGNKSGNRTGHRETAGNQYFRCFVRAAVFCDLLSGKLYRLRCLAQNIGPRTRGGSGKKLVVALLGSRAFRSGGLNCKRQACNDQKTAKEQPCQPMARTLNINVCEHLRQNWQLSLTPLQEWWQIGPDPTRFQVRLSSRLRKDVEKRIHELPLRLEYRSAGTWRFLIQKERRTGRIFPTFRYGLRGRSIIARCCPVYEVRWLSGRKRRTRNAVCQQWYLGFESLTHLHRQSRPDVQPDSGLTGVPSRPARHHFLTPTGLRAVANRRSLRDNRFVRAGKFISICFRQATG